MKNINHPKEIFSEQKRIENFTYLNNKYSSKVIISCLFEKDMVLSGKSSGKYILSGELTINHLLDVLCKKETFKTDSIFIFTEIGQLMVGHEKLKDISFKYSDKDGFLYLYIKSSYK